MSATGVEDHELAPTRRNMDLFFDLDGTLTDPAKGITLSLQHALRRLGREPPVAEALIRYIGPPLRNTFIELLATERDAVIDEAIAYYRERFSTVGLFENAVYPMSFQISRACALVGTASGW